jgi:hypothetical protein
MFYAALLPVEHLFSSFNMSYLKYSYNFHLALKANLVYFVLCTMRYVYFIFFVEEALCGLPLGLSCTCLTEACRIEYLSF